MVGRGTCTVCTWKIFCGCLKEAPNNVHVVLSVTYMYVRMYVGYVLLGAPCY